MQKKTLLTLATVLPLLVTTTACGTSSGNKASNSSAGQHVTLRFAINSADDKTLLTEVKDFEQQNPNITIQTEPIPWTQFFNKVETMVAGGQEPDVIDTPALATSHYQSLGLLLNLTPYVSSSDVKDFVPGPLSTVQYGGNLYGLPLDTDGIAVFYNKDLFAKAGVQVPTSLANNWNWDQFIQAAQKVKAANHLKYGLAMGNDVSQWLPFLYANQGTVLNKGQTAGGLDTPQGVQAISFFNSWYQQGLAPKNVFLDKTPNVVDQLFAQGQLPLAIDFSGDIKVIQNNSPSFKWGETYLPTEKVFGNKLGGWDLLAFKSTKHPTEAAKFIQFLTNEQNMVNYCQATTEIPVRFSAQKSVNYGTFNQDMKVTTDEINATPAFAVKDFATSKYLGYKSILTSELQAVLLGQLTPEQAAKKIDNEINKTVF